MKIYDKRLREYERRLLEDKRWLHELMYMYDSEDKMYKKRLEYYEDELRHMEEQYRKLYIECTGSEPAISVNSKVQTNTSVNNKVQDGSETNTLVNNKVQAGSGNNMLIGTHLAPDGTPVSAETVDRYKAKVAASEVAQKADEVKNTAIEATPVVDNIEEPIDIKTLMTMDMRDIAKVKDIEKIMGKFVMGVAASILIFVSLVMFAGSINPSLTNILKMITMYVLSFAFIGFGLYKIHRNPNDKFFLTITGCGVGALYITIIMSNMYFKAIGDIVLYVLIAIWSVGVCYLSKQKNIMFMIIGHLGITIAIYAGTGICAHRSDGSMFTALIIFYIISASVFNVVHYNRDFSKNVFNYVINIINVLMLCESYTVIYDEKVEVAGVIILFILLAYLTLMLFSKLENTTVAFPIVLLIYMYGLTSFMGELMTSNVYGIILYIISLVIVVSLDRRTWGNEITEMLSIIVGILYMIVGAVTNETCADYAFLYMVVIPLLVYGYVRSNSLYKYCAIGILICYNYQSVIDEYIVEEYLGTMHRYIVSCIILIAAIVLIYRFKYEYSKIYKYTVHIAMFLQIFFIGMITISNLFDADDLAVQLAFIVATIYNALMMKFFGDDFETDEPEEHRMYSAINLIMMFVGLFIIGDAVNPFIHFVLIAVAVVAFMINSKKYLDYEDSIWPGIYVGAKFVLLLIVILDSFDAAGYVISIACFIFAIISIVCGFRFYYKSLRIFGLILSMVSIFKLLVIDINYGNSVGNALSFFASGVLCFAISLIYNYIDKKMSK
ncbi:MAG: DUF2339 domain-containing protein [Lachnospiraceae bacterium]|nr:DUF2339 domain-containing protein [Lachnospiraceae bacterium]